MKLEKNIAASRKVSCMSLYSGEGCNLGNGNGGNCVTGSGTGAGCKGNNCSTTIIYYK